jgi:hypothetical protein
MIRNMTEIETERNRDGTEINRTEEQDGLREHLPTCK